MDAPAAKSKLIKGATGDWEVVIGMEVHAQVTSRAKLFSGASTEFGGEPNSHVSLVDAAMPGMLPVINAECVRQAVRTGLGLKAQINSRSVFDRKNYFYPDLPQGYQISQYKSPIVGEGEVLVDMPDGETVRVGIERLHLEQDAGKSLHDQHATMSLRRSQSFRRGADGDRDQAGSALRRGGQRPSSASCAPSCATSAPATATWRRVILRADVNVSVRKPGRRAGHALRDQEPQFDPLHRPGDRARGVATDRRRSRTAARSSRRRGCSIRTRAKRGRCADKEEAHDYRYFPDPDLLPLELVAVAGDGPGGALCRNCRTTRRRASCASTGFPATTPACSSPSARPRNISKRSLRTSGRGQARDPKLAANWVINELAGRLNREGRNIAAAPVSAGATRRHSRSRRRQHDLRQDRQGRFRDRLERGRRSARHRRSARPAAGDRSFRRSRSSSTRSSPKIPTKSATRRRIRR